MTETFYDCLGVDADATAEEIEDAYREAIKRVHPDVSDDVDAGERTKRLNEAKRVLTDDEERARYDRLGHAAYTGEGTPDAGSTRTAAGSGDGETSSGSGRRSRSRSGPESAEAESRAGGPDSGASSRTGRTGSGESTWRGSQQRGRRSGPDRSAGRTDRRRRERTRGTAGGTSRSTGRSTNGSAGSSWQSNGAAAGAGAGGSSGSPSAQRQAAAGASNGTNVDWSWNAWDATGAWAVRNGSDGTDGPRFSRLFPVDQSVVLLVSTFVCYPFFVAATLFPAFPLVARVTVGVCTLLTFAYLLSIPEAAILVFGLWSVVVPILLLAVPGLGVFSLAGVVGLTATWVPLGMSVLTFTLVRS